MTLLFVGLPTFVMANTIESLQVQVSNRQILRIALPISLALLVPQLNFITNNIFLGHYDVEALGMASITGVYYLVFAGIGYGFNNGVQALIARRAGENRPEEIGSLFRQGVYISLIIAAIGILLTWFVAPVILDAVITDPKIYNDSVTFLRIRIWGLPFLYIYQMRNALLVGTNQSRYIVPGTVAEALANVFFDAALIFGAFGFPRLGFNGAAYASIIAEFAGMFVIFIVIKWKGISKRFSLFGKYRWHRAHARSIFAMSAPLAFQHAISIISWLFFYILIQRNALTKYDLAISNTMRNIFGIFGVFSWAFAATSSTMVSNIIGQGRPGEVKRLIGKIVRISMAISLVACVLLNLFPRLFLSIYGQDDAFTLYAVPVVRVVGSAMVMMSFATVWLNAVTGTGNTRVTFIIEVAAIVMYGLYVFLVLEEFQLSIVYGWMSEWIYWTVLFSLSFFYIRSGKWKGKRI